MCTNKHTLWAGLLAAAALMAGGPAAAAGADLKPVPALRSSAATTAQILAAAQAGARLVAVGDHGVVLLSDDGGKAWRQAKAVPVSSQLNAVSMVSATQGWAVGQWGAILHTSDGGETWQLQRLDVARDRPLFAVHFFDDQHGVAVGLWSLILTTDDGGKTWAEQKIAPPAKATKADLNLLGLFAGNDNQLYATAERGHLLVSGDRGKTWTYSETGYKGSLWAGAALPDGELLVGGQRGRLLRGRPGGTWQDVPSRSTGSISAIAVAGNHVAVVGLDGLVGQSHDGGRQFSFAQRPDGAALTAALMAPEGGPLLFSRRGPLTINR